MENIIATVVGALIAGIAMIANSYYSTRRQQQIEERNRAVSRQDEELKVLSTLYEEILNSLNRFIRNLGSGSAKDLDAFHKLETQLNLHSTPEITSACVEVRNEVAKMAKDLPPMPEEFIPKFEDDGDRYNRLQARKEAEAERSKKAQKYLPEIWAKHKELGRMMKEHVETTKRALSA